jgi:ketosteroid isomerase-like protein
MAMNKHLETVAKIYEAFGKGDAAAFISNLAQDVRWEEWTDNSAQQAGVPWLKSGTGIEAAINFFKVVGELKFKRFEVKSFMEGSGQVAAEVVIEMEIPATGTTFQDEEIHLWTFNDAGQVMRLRHYLDTAKHMQAAKIPSIDQ